MPKYDLIAVHWAAENNGQLVPMGIERAKLAGENYTAGNAEYIVCLGDKKRICRNWILTKFPIPSSKVISQGGRSSFQEAFNLKDYSIIYGARRLAIDSQKLHNDIQLRPLYNSIMPAGIESDFLDAQDPKWESPEILVGFKRKLKIAAKADQYRLHLPENLARSDMIDWGLDTAALFLMRLNILPAVEAYL